jgi:hypothetical protein
LLLLVAACAGNHGATTGPSHSVARRQSSAGGPTGPTGIAGPTGPTGTSNGLRLPGGPTGATGPTGPSPTGPGPTGAAGGSSSGTSSGNRLPVGPAGAEPASSTVDNTVDDAVDNSQFEPPHVDEVATNGEVSQDAAAPATSDGTDGGSNATAQAVAAVAAGGVFLLVGFALFRKYQASSVAAQAAAPLEWDDELEISYIALDSEA